MTVTQVLYALEVARCQNVSRAAERLLLSQSALSQQLRRLEQELGYPIFTRTLHGVQLTPEGERILNAYERFAADINAYSQERFQENFRDLVEQP